MPISWNGDEIFFKVKGAAGRGVMAAAERVLETAVRKIKNPPKTGRIYTIRGVVHQASAPGEPPADDTGALAASGQVQHDVEEASSRVLFTAAHAPALELGTERMEARPYLRPSLAEEADNIRGYVGREIRRELRK